MNTTIEPRPGETLADAATRELADQLRNPRVNGWEGANWSRLTEAEISDVWAIDRMAAELGGPPELPSAEIRRMDAYLDRLFEREPTDTEVNQ